MMCSEESPQIKTTRDEDNTFVQPNFWNLVYKMKLEVSKAKGRAVDHMTCNKADWAFSCVKLIFLVFLLIYSVPHVQLGHVL